MLKRLLLPLFVFVLCACQPAEQKKMQFALPIASGKPVERDTELVFPKEHGIHWEQGIEWWYLTANLQSDAGETRRVPAVRRMHRAVPRRRAAVSLRRRPRSSARNRTKHTPEPTRPPQRARGIGSKRRLVAHRGGHHPHRLLPSAK